MNITANTKIVKVVASRGWTSGFYEIVRFGDVECQVRHIQTGQIDVIYKAHLCVDSDTLAYEKKWRAERATKIGKKA